MKLVFIFDCDNYGHDNEMCWWIFMKRVNNAPCGSLTRLSPSHDACKGGEDSEEPNTFDYVVDMVGHG